MASELLPRDLLREVAPEDVVAHAEAKGWQRHKISRDDLAVLDSPGDGAREIVIPFKSTVESYTIRIADAIDRFSEQESRSVYEVLNDLLARSADVLRFRVVASRNESGTLSVEEGAKLYGGLRASLLAAARSVMDPQRSYAVLATKSAEEFIKKCRIGQTERGSYVATVACPMNALPERKDEEGVPFSRQATGLLLNTMSAVSTAVDAGNEEALLELQDRNIVVSSNLCEAIALMQPEDDGSDSTLDVRCSWAPSVSAAPTAPSVVKFRASSRPILERVAKQLKENAPEPYTSYLASIEGLRGEPDVTKRRLGEIIVKLSDQGHVKTVRMEVRPDDYAMAGVAHVRGRGVSFRARLVRRVRSAYIEEYTDFAELEVLPNLNPAE